MTDLPIGYSGYLADPANARYLGPAGADFRTAFGLGGSDVSVAPADLGGVALVAIKALAATDASFGTQPSDRSTPRLKAVEAKVGIVEGSVPSLAPVNQQITAGESADRRPDKAVTGAAEAAHQAREDDEGADQPQALDRPATSIGILT